MIEKGVFQLGFFYLKVARSWKSLTELPDGCPLTQAKDLARRRGLRLWSKKEN